jgi:SAM-dependent methyltransferase
MSASIRTCRICAGPLELRFRGTPGGPSPESFSPTYHGTGQHGDLYECRECATVQQPSLPGGDALHGLYRDMSDTDYLVEEEGRRATANRLLDQVGGYVAHGSLLDVGCGHGVLLDEARKRGYESTGLELSADAARHARDSLGLDVHEVPLESFDPGARRFDVIMLADVIEHLEDPVGALDRCHELLADGGVLVVVTPDPSSRTAQVAGSKWWGYIPAHMCLLPRKTLRELLAARGLVISEDGPLVRTFSAGYWLNGMAERGGPVGSAAKLLAGVLGDRRSITASLGDERVILAHKVKVREPVHTLVPDRGGPTKVHIVLPAYKASATIPTVAKEIPVGVADRALLVDDASPDDTTGVALQEGFEVIRHPGNRGYGANQMTCYTRAILDGADIVVMVHADNQYDPTLVSKMVRPIERGEADVVIGSRLLEDEAIAGGMPRWKWIGNRFLTWIENRAFRTGFSEFHTGYRAFSADILREIAFLRNSDGFVFDQEIFAQLVRRGARVHEIAIPTRYFLEASSVSFTRSVEYGLRTLVVLGRFRLDERRGGWPLVRHPAVRLRRSGSLEEQPELRAPRAG